MPIIDDIAIFEGNITKIPLTCPATWDLISSGNTKGMFQIESQLGQRMAKDMRPQNIEELSALIALMRPGCISKDTKIVHSFYISEKGKKVIKRISMEGLYKKFHNRNKSIHIMSFDDNTGQLIRNEIKNVIMTGTKKVYQIRSTKFSSSRGGQRSKQYDLKCTEDHRIYTSKGWKQLKDMEAGDRFLVIKYKGSRKPVKLSPGQRNFRDICFKNYEYHCAMCDWKKASLDVNHLEGSRFTNNDPNNLVFLCPNHHRMYTENKLDKTTILYNRQKYELPQYENLEWAEFHSKEYVETTDVYDITMNGPHHNFIAGNTVVHNCMESIVDGKSLTQHYIDRKSGQDPVTYFHPSLEPIFKDTLGVMTYQEQAIRIARDIAGLNEADADYYIRKGIGKKNTEIIAEGKPKFLAGCAKLGLVTEQEALEIWSWIEKCQRYSFNKSHSVAYAHNTYLSAYAKTHCMADFFTSYLHYSKDKNIKPLIEVRQLINNARYSMTKTDVRGPSFIDRNDYFFLKGSVIRFGLVNVKGIGKSAYDKMEALLERAEFNPESITWMEYLCSVAPYVNKTAVNGMIKAGAVDHFNISRTRMLYEFEKYQNLSQREQDWVEQRAKTFYSLEEALKALLDAPTGKKGGIYNKRGVVKVQGLLHSVQNPPYALDDSIEICASFEEELLGVSMTYNRTDSISNPQANCTCKQFLRGNIAGLRKVVIGCQIDDVKEITTKKNKQMAFLTVSDHSCELDSVTVFSKAWEDHKSKLLQGNLVFIVGRRDEKQGSFILENVWEA